MRRVLRLMLVLGVLVGAVWVSTSLEIRGKTPFGHALVWWKKHGEHTPDRGRPQRKEAVRPAAPKPVEKEATARRVALLEKAALELSKTPAESKLGEKPSAGQKKALDELVTSQVATRSR